jgi:phage baseplate assembly protein W
MAIKRSLSIEDGNLDKSTTLKGTKNREYVDIDLSFEPRPTTGDIYKKRNANAVKQAVKNLLMTNEGEKPFSPYFGGNLNSFLFELADVGAENDIIFNIKENIRVFEPRVNYNTLVVDVNVNPDYNEIAVTIIFQIINTNETVEFTTRLNRLR